MHNESLALARHAEDMRDTLESRSLHLEEQARRQERDRFSLVAERSEMLKDRAETIRLERGVKRQHEQYSPLELEGEGFVRDSAYLDKLISSVMASSTTPSRSRASRTWNGRDSLRSPIDDGRTRPWGSHTTPAALAIPNKANPTAVPVAPQAADPNLTTILKAQAKTRQFLQEHDDFLASCSPNKTLPPPSSSTKTPSVA